MHLPGGFCFIRLAKDGRNNGNALDAAPCELLDVLSCDAADGNHRNGNTLMGLLGRRQNDWRAVEELTDALRAFDAEDPARYDFSLFGAGMDGYLNEQ